MKKLCALFLVGFMLCSVIGCGQKSGNDKLDHPQKEETQSVTITDAKGNTATLTKKARVVSLYASFSECWLLAGGQLAGVTQDAISERHLDLGDDVAVVGTVKEPNLEKIVAQNPDYVILSAELTNHASLEESLKKMGIAYGSFQVDTFSEYQQMMKQFCAVNQRDDLYQKNVVEVQKRIDAIKKKIPKDGKEPSVLLMRTFSSGVKAKSDDNLAGQILKEFSCNNIADANPSMLEDLSLEKVVKENPDYVFVLTMGEEEKATAYLENNLENNLAWQELSAVKNKRYVILPKELFHYKPNNRWDESYEYLAKILYPEIFNENAKE